MTTSWSRSGKKLTADDLSKAEVALGLPIPSQFREFLLKTNGGIPKLRGFDYVSDEKERAMNVTCIFDLADVLRVAGQYRREAQLPAHQIPIGFADEDNLLVIDGEKVLIHSNIEAGIGSWGSSNDAVAGSFDEFVQKLRGPKRAVLTESDKFVRACENNQIKKVQKFLADGVDWTVVARPAFVWAFCWMRQSELALLAMLFEAGAPRDVRGEYGYGGHLRLGGEDIFSPDERMKEYILQLQERIGFYGESDPHAVKFQAEVEQLQGLLVKYYGG
jgi:SMI1-KNR4 cell-wall